MDMNKKETKPQVQSVTYTCPMHPEIQANSPGNCPECGMKLIKEKFNIQHIHHKRRNSNLLQGLGFRKTRCLQPRMATQF